MIFNNIRQRLSEKDFNAFINFIQNIENYTGGKIDENKLWKIYWNVLDESPEINHLFNKDPQMAVAHDKFMMDLDMYESDEDQRRMYGYLDSPAVKESAKQFLVAVDAFDKAFLP